MGKNEEVHQSLKTAFFEQAFKVYNCFHKVYNEIELLNKK